MPLITTVKKKGQHYLDEPIIINPKKVSTIDMSIAATFGRELPKQITVGYERVHLRWMMPDGNGGLIPKK